MRNLLNLGMPFETNINAISRKKQQMSMYTFGGGTVGGPNVFISGERGPELNPDIKDDVILVPSGAAGDTPEWRRIKAEAKRTGKNLVEAPKEYKSGVSSGKWGVPSQDPNAFYDPITGEKFSGTMMWTGEGWRGAGLGPQGSQRSWSSYAGDKPIERYKGTDFYEDSPSWGRGGSGVAMF